MRTYVTVTNPLIGGFYYTTLWTPGGNRNLMVLVKIEKARMSSNDDLLLFATLIAGDPILFLVDPAHLFIEQGFQSQPCEAGLKPSPVPPTSPTDPPPPA